MQVLLNRLNVFFEQLPDFSRKHRVKVWALFIGLTILIGAGVTRFQIDMSLEAYFREEDPVKQAYDRFRTMFGSDENLFIVYESKDGDIFSDAALKAVQGIQNELENYRFALKEGESSALDHIKEVDTILSVSYTEANEDALISRQFIGEDLPQSTEAREALRQQAVAHPDYLLTYFSKNYQYGGIVIRTDFNAALLEELVVPNSEGEIGTDAAAALDDEEEFFDDEEGLIDMEETVAVDSESPEVAQFQKAGMPDYIAFMKEVRAILEKPEYQDALIFHPVGQPEVMSFFGEIIMGEMMMVTLASLLLIAVVMGILFRALSAVVWSVLVVIFSLVWIVGLVGWTGVTMTFMINIIIFLILAVGVADTVHILSGYLYFRNQGQDHATAMRSVFRKSALACTLTSVTTAIGLLALVFVPIVPIRNFGIFASLGVFFAYFFTVFWLPVMLDLWSPVAKKPGKKVQTSNRKPHLIQRLLQRIEHVSYAAPLATVLVFAVLGVVLVYGASKIRVDSNLVEIIPESTPLRQTYLLVDEYMSGTQNMEILFDAGKADALKNPKVLNTIEGVQEYLESKYPDLVLDTYSLVNVTKDSYKALNEGRPEMYIIPQDPHVLDQTLFLFNNANPSDRRELVSDDYSQSRITVRLRNEGSAIYVDIVEELRAYIDQAFAPLRNEYPQLDISITGGFALMVQLLDYISWSQIQSFGLALAVISLLLLIVFGSKRVGFIAVFPNLFPIISVFGIMGYLDIALDTDTLLIAPIIIGIAVDDTIHFLTHYRAEMLKHGNIQQAIVHSFREAGQAIVFTSIILSIGFCVFIMSTHLGLRNFGILSAIAISVAVIADLLLLPAMCMLFQARFRKAELAREPSPQAA